jgi:Fe-S-cluster-containing hydrogenase component 2
MDSDTAEVDQNLCIGCGLCASTCPEDSISMVLRENNPQPSNTISELGAQILLEKGRLQEYDELNKH